MVLKEKDDSVLIILESQALKNIINAIRVYDKNFTINDCDIDKAIALDTLDALLFMFHDHLNNLIDGTAPRNDDTDNVDLSDEIDLMIDDMD